MPPAKLGSRSGASFIPDAAAIQKSLAILPVSTYEVGETVIAAGETSGKLLFLRQGLVEVAKEGTRSPGFPSRAQYSASWPLCWVSPIQPTCGPSNDRSSVSPTQRLCLQSIRPSRFTWRLYSLVDSAPRTVLSSRSSASSRPASPASRLPGRWARLPSCWATWRRPRRIRHPQICEGNRENRKSGER